MLRLLSNLGFYMDTFGPNVANMVKNELFAALDRDIRLTLRKIIGPECCQYPG